MTTTGGGSEEAIYVGTVRVVVSAPKVFAHRIAKRAPVERGVPRKPRAASVSGERKEPRVSYIYATAPVPFSYPLTHAEEVFVSSQQATTIIVHTAGYSVVAQRKKPLKE